MSLSLKVGSVQFQAPADDVQPKDKTLSGYATIGEHPSNTHSDTTKQETVPKRRQTGGFYRTITMYNNSCQKLASGKGNSHATRGEKRDQHQKGKNTTKYRKAHGWKKTTTASGHVHNPPTRLPCLHRIRPHPGTLRPYRRRPWRTPRPTGVRSNAIEIFFFDLFVVS